MEGSVSGARLQGHPQLDADIVYVCCQNISICTIERGVMAQMHSSVHGEWVRCQMAVPTEHNDSHGHATRGCCSSSCTTPVAAGKGSKEGVVAERVKQGRRSARVGIVAAGGGRRCCWAACTPAAHGEPALQLLAL